MDDFRIIDGALLDQVAALARGSPRRRRNHNFHAAVAAPCQRLLNAAGLLPQV